MGFFEAVFARLISDTISGVWNWFFPKKKAGDAPTSLPAAPVPASLVLPPMPVPIPVTNAKEVNYTGTVFTPNDPYPEGFKIANLGCKVSILRTLFPHGNLNSTGYSFSISEGPFCFVYYSHEAKGHDPKVTQVSFDVRRDGKALEFIRQQALEAFGSKPVSKVQGTILRWQVAGLQVQIEDDRYEIRPKSARYMDEMLAQ